MQTNKNRPTRDEIYMATAKLFSSRNICGRLNVGAVAVRDKRIIATGYNGPLLIPGDKLCNCPRSNPCNEAIHAEANLVAFAAKEGISLQYCTVYLTHFPCRKCQELIVQAGVSAIVWDAEYREMDNKVLEFGNVIIRKYEGRPVQDNFFGE